MKGKQATVLTKREFDSKVQEFLSLDESVKSQQKRMKELKTMLESQYQDDPEVKEIIHGHLFLMEKVPVNNGANNYDVQLLKPFLKKIGQDKEVIEVIEVVNVAKLDNLVKEGFLPKQVVDKARKDKWTFKSAFKHIESAVKTIKNKVKAAI